MKINWKIRLRNRVWLTAMCSAAAAFIFDVLALMDIMPIVSEEGVMQAVNALLTLLMTLGVVIDPTTDGASDSELAMTYE